MKSKANHCELHSTCNTQQSGRTQLRSSCGGRLLSAPSVGPRETLLISETIILYVKAGLARYGPRATSSPPR